MSKKKAVKCEIKPDILSRFIHLLLQHNKIIQKPVYSDLQALDFIYIYIFFTTNALEIKMGIFSWVCFTVFLFYTRRDGFRGMDWVASHHPQEQQKKKNIMTENKCNQSGQVSRLIIRLFTVLQSCLKTLEMSFQRPEISKFLEEACPRTPPDTSHSGFRTITFLL